MEAAPAIENRHEQHKSRVCVGGGGSGVRAECIRTVS